MATPLWHADRRRYGAGKLFVAPLGTITSAYAPVSTGSKFVLGTSATNVPGSTAWLPLGYTAEGHTFTQSVDTDDDTAAESLYPVATPVTGKTARWAVTLKTVNLTTLRVALNAFDASSTVVTNVSGSGGQVPGVSTVVKVKPPVAGSEVRCQFLWINNDDDDVIVGYRALNVGDFERAFKKGAEGQDVPLEFNLELPETTISTTPYDEYLTGASYIETVSAD